MKRLLAIALFGTLAASAEEGMRSGKATAQWLVAKQQDGVIETIVRLWVDDPWHVYWYNPGEAGMPTSVEMKMPEGWRSSGLIHPVPKKFKTGGLHGFGHEGTVDYVLNLYAPEGFKGDAEFEAVVSWLSCNDEACVPGEVTLKLKLVDGQPVGARMDDAAIQSAHDKLPLGVDESLKLTLKDGGDHWDLSLAGKTEFLAGALKLAPSKADVFIETQELVPADAVVKFKQVDDRWEATAPKGEFAPEKPEACAILLVEEGKRAVRVEWKAQ